MSTSPSSAGVPSWYMSDLLGRNAPFVEIPQAHHHLLLDQPLAFITAVRALLADWEHSVPARGVAEPDEVGDDGAAERPGERGGDPAENVVA